jgi:hypothetical protein
MMGEYKDLAVFPLSDQENSVPGLFRNFRYLSLKSGKEATLGYSNNNYY